VDGAGFTSIDLVARVDDRLAGRKGASVTVIGIIVVVATRPRKHAHRGCGDRQSKKLRLHGILVSSK
jgi:hypothetical protein